MKSTKRILVSATTFAATFALFAGHSFAKHCCGEPTGGVDGSVPEIGAGSAAAAIALISGAGYMLRERFFSKNTDNKES
jgi:hypothetical protein